MEISPCAEIEVDGTGIKILFPTTKTLSSAILLELTAKVYIAASNI